MPTAESLIIEKENIIMQVITAPITRDEPRENRAAIIANLQNALLRLLCGRVIPKALERQPFFEEGLKKELRDHLYGDITQQLVSMFQAQFPRREGFPGGLLVTGTVDDATAMLLNTSLAELDALGVVVGKVTNQDGSPVVGNLLIAFDEENIGGAFLGQANSNAVGAYMIFYDPFLYARAGAGVLKVKEIIDLVVQVYDANGATLAESQSLHNPGRNVQVDLKIKDLPLGDSIIIRGQIVDANQRGLSEHQIILSEYDLDGTTQIKSTASKADGAFNFRFNVDDTLRQGDETTAPDLLFQVFDPGGAEQTVSSVLIIEGEQETAVPRLADSRRAPIVLMNVSASLVLRIVVDTQPLTEFEQLVARLTPFMRQIQFADLKEDETNFQISFLSHESSVESAKIEQLRDAFHHERESAGVPAWAFFGIASRNLSLIRTASLPLAELASVLAPLQPASDQSNPQVVASNLQQFARNHTRQTQITNLKTSLGELIQPVSLSDDKLHTFLDAYVRHEGDDESFWRVMGERADFQEEVPKIQLTLQLSQLTLNNSGLVNGLQRKGIENMRQLADLSAADWESLALEHKAGIPLHITGENDLARAKAYAGELQALTELAFPTEVIKKSIQHPEVKTFLKQNPAFDFTRTPVETYLQGQGEQALEGIENPEAVKGQLRQIQRLYSLTANAADLNVLMDMQYDSAHQIAKLSPEDFARSLGGRISEENAYLYHGKAMAINETSAMVFHQLRDLGIASTPLAAKNLSGTPSALQDLPDWQSLFVALDMCECQHCKSVYSPAAYFVDLLHVLLGQNNGAARKEIFRRRPDILYTKLSCEHTETLIPYIDLVNEVLETYVAQNHVGDADAKSHAEISTNDTSGFSSSDLAANPQHPNANADKDAQTAYLKLEGASFPLSLPFAMNLETARQLLQAQNSRRFEVMQIFGNAESLATAAEGLGISQREFEVLTLTQLDGVTDAGIDQINDLWGSPAIPAGKTLGEVLAHVDLFLERTGIAYSDLISLLHTRFLNPNFPLNVFLQSLSTSDRNAWLAAHPDEAELAQTVIELGADVNDGCNLSKTFILHLSGEFLSDNELSRFNRFIRLWKKLGCTITELDGLLTALQAVELTPQGIQELSILWQVRESLRLPLDRLAVLIGDIPTAGNDSLFARLMLNKAILQIDAIFALNVGQTELENTTEKLEAHVPAMLAAFRISEEDLHRLVEYTQLDLASDELNLASLSKIYRYIVFAKGLRIKIKDLIIWLRLISLSPWSTPAGLLTAQESLAKLQRYGFKAADFAYIFQDARASGDTLPPADEIIAQSAKTLREGLQKIRQENTRRDDNITADFLKTELGILLEPEEVSKIIGILDGSNTRNPFNYLLAPKVSNTYKDILQNYLTPADVANLAAITDIPTRLKTYWQSIEKRLLPVLRETFVQQHMIADFKVEADIVALMLQEAAILQICLDVETDAPAQAQAYAEQYVLMHKFTWLAGRLKLSGKELGYFENNPNFGNFSWKIFDFELWLRLADFAALRDSLPSAESALPAIFETAKNSGDVAKAIIEVTAWDQANVEHFVSLRSAGEFLNEIALLILQRQIAVSEQIGVSIEKLESWATDVVTHDQSQDIKRTLKAKYDEGAWIEVSTIVHNRLRSQLRDALVAYLLWKPEIKALGLNDSNALYAYFLIDLEMDSCMLTSRLKQAIASVQLFVQRCLLNLEAPTIAPKQIDANQWKWMKNYRVWEANRKVFLYPENWIEPELRDNKSPFFKELESELLQGEVTNESVETALNNYLEKLHDVARLDICGIYEDSQAQELHVFGRTFGSPGHYFYRKLNLETRVWSAWERVQLDIQGNEEGDSAGVHLIPVVWNRRLYLFWPVFTEKSDRDKINIEKQEYKNWQKRHDDWKQGVAELKEEKRRLAEQHLGNTKQFEPEPPELEVDNPWAYYEVRMAWSEYKNHAWSNKKVSQSFIRTESAKLGVAATNYYRFSLNLDSTLKIKLHFFPSQLHPIGEYQLNCDGKMSAFTTNEAPVLLKVIAPEQVNIYQGLLSAQSSGRAIGWHKQSSVALKLRNSGGDKDVLSGSAEEYKVVFPADHNFSDNGSSKFIYQDQKRNYYVEAEWWVNNFIPSLTDPSKVAIPQVKSAIKETVKITAWSDSGRIDQVDNFSKLSSATLNQSVDKGKIAASTALQIRSVQTLAAPISILSGKESLTPGAAKIGATYVGASQFSTLRLEFKPFFHAYVCKFRETLNKGGIEGLLNLYNQQYSDLEFIFSSGGIAGAPIPTGLTNTFKKLYGPNKNNVAEPYPMEDVDFSPAGAYSLYNWELFFHVPMLLANRLSKNQRFEEAIRWYHFIFNPTTNDGLNSSARYWQMIPLRNTPQETLESLMKQLHNPPGDPKRRELEAAITAWRKYPFSPHLIARTRLSAYQKNTVMKYLDNLIAWADNLFRQDTIEAINEATQLYILAAELLGKRPEKIPARGKVQAFNYAELEKAGLDAFSNALVKLETIFPFYNLQAVPPGSTSAASALNTTAPSLYFCLPNNDKLLGYWDTVADRLFKIRHCQNIEGIERQLALFEPPIDPALLVQAVAGGVDISSVLADLNAPLPHYRFTYIVQKALEICAELKSLGNSLLAALEKRDGERLSMIRAEHEASLLNLAKIIKNFQITEAQRNREGLELTQEVIQTRLNYYGELIATKLIEAEKEHAKKLELAKDRQDDAYGVELAANLAHILPDFSIPDFKFSYGGSHIGSGLNAWARSINFVASGYTYEANRSSINASNERRLSDWIFQQAIAKKELAQIDKQILASQIREKISEQDLINHEQQIDNARQVADFFRNKYTREELYGWMIGEISTIYFQCYQLAYDLAKKAEKAYRYELGLPTSNFVQFGVWDSFRKGLLAGERLYLSLKQMEKSFMEQHRRDYEITKHLSLLQQNPLALLSLRETGTCTVDLPEALFDVDYPGHYMRRLKTVSLTIPCVVGPYTSVNCTLTLLKSKTRISSIDVGSYADDVVSENPRVATNFAATESIVTSSAQNDNGMFELNFRDERYLPFEGSGAISLWRIELPKDFRQFDYDTISDVVLHIRYTSREGGVALQKAALNSLKKLLEAEVAKPQTRLFSLRHEFPSEWHRLQSLADNNGDHKQAFSLNKQRFPFMFQGNKRQITVSRVELFGAPKGAEVPALKLTLTDPEGQAVPLQAAAVIGLLAHSSADTDLEVKSLGNDGNEADWTIQVKKADVAASLNRLEDILVLCHYSIRDA
jgi:hypothetical protein